MSQLEHELRSLKDEVIDMWKLVQYATVKSFVRINKL